MADTAQTHNLTGTSSLGSAPVRWWLALAALVAAVIVVRFSGPSDLLDNDQLRPASYATDIVANGQWIVQRDALGDIASKPPVCAWISAIWAEATGGRVTRLGLALPGMIGFAGMAAITLWAGARYLGVRAGWWGAMALVLSPMGFKQSILVRTDSLYGFAGALAGIALWEAIRRGGPTWLVFWIVGAFTILVKGPVALVLPLGGLLAWKWPRDGSASDTVPRPSWMWHILGVGIVVACVGGWFWAAWHDSGQAFIDRVLGRELFGHVLRNGAGTPPFAECYLPPLYYLSRFAPGSLFTAIGVWGLFRHPSSDAVLRRFERFIAWWFLVGIAIFSIAPHQRPDLLTPIWVAGSLIAGREIARMTTRLGVSARRAIACAATALGLAGGVVMYHVSNRAEVEVKAEAAIRDFAHDLIARFDGTPRVMHVTDNSSFQFYLGERVTKASTEEALACLAGDAACAIAVSAKSEVRADAEAAGLQITELGRSGGPPEYDVVILGNSAAASDARWPRPTP